MIEKLCPNCGFMAKHEKIGDVIYVDCPNCTKYEIKG